MSVGERPQRALLFLRFLCGDVEDQGKSPAYTKEGTLYGDAGRSLCRSHRY
jgi:hypothetical protein